MVLINRAAKAFLRLSTKDKVDFFKIMLQDKRIVETLHYSQLDKAQQRVWAHHYPNAAAAMGYDIERTSGGKIK